MTRRSAKSVRRKQSEAGVIRPSVASEAMRPMTTTSEPTDASAKSVAQRRLAVRQELVDLGYAGFQADAQVRIDQRHLSEFGGASA